MNIFAVHSDPRLAALELPDKLVPKMLVESAQMLSTAHRVLDGDASADAKGLYQKAYENHPSCVWVREDAMNYWWVWMHALTLAEEYKWRFSPNNYSTLKSHKTAAVIHNLQDPPVNIPREKEQRVEVLEDLPLCMPDQYKETGARWYGYAVDCYQKFVTQDKPYMEDVFKAYTRAIQKKQHDSTTSQIEYPPRWVAQNATAEQMKHITLHKLMNPEKAV